MRTRTPITTTTIVARGGAGFASGCRFDSAEPTVRVVEVMAVVKLEICEAAPLPLPELRVAVVAEVDEVAVGFVAAVVVKVLVDTVVEVVVEMISAVT